MQTNTAVNNGRAVIQLEGRFDYSAHRVLRECFGKALESNDVRELDLDLGRVEYLDSSALGMLLLLKERADAVCKRVILRNCKGTVKQVLDIANFGKLFSFV